VVLLVTGPPPQLDQVIALADVVDVVRAFTQERVATTALLAASRASWDFLGIIRTPRYWAIVFKGRRLGTRAYRLCLDFDNSPFGHNAGVLSRHADVHPND
jgi:hypothetical protein